MKILNGTWRQKLGALESVEETSFGFVYGRVRVLEGNTGTIRVLVEHLEPA